jgi:hypothetical protein
MGKIKNWDKVSPGSGAMRWVNEHPTAKSKFGKTLNRGSVQIEQDSNGNWVVMIRRYRYEDGRTVWKDTDHEKYSTKEKARKRAVKWMKNHPQG